MLHYWKAFVQAIKGSCLPKAKSPPLGSFESPKLVYPEHLDRSIYDDFVSFKDKLTSAKCNNTMYENGSIYDMITGLPVTNQSQKDMEQKFAAAAIAEDKAAGAGAPCNNSACNGCSYCHFSTMRIHFASRVDFLVGMCFVLNLWDWTTRDVVIFLVKSSTEKWRCRFAVRITFYIPYSLRESPKCLTPW